MRSLASHLSDPALGDPPPAGALVIEGCAGGSCGVIAHFYLDVDEHGVIQECSARIRGRDVAFATASALCEAARGGSIIDAARLGVRSGLHEDFRSMDTEQLERAMVVEDAFHHALGQWVRAAAAQGLSCNLGIDRLVGMSGGVDSAVALYDSAAATSGRAAGITLRMWIDPRAPDPDSACCSPDSVRRARVTCHEAGYPHLSIDVRQAFARAVVTPFVQQYALGNTPNPCVTCNGGFRLHELVDIADAVGAQHIVTGHYVQRIEDPDGVVLVGRGVDARKDQSYMLARLAPELTRRFLFPLGATTKPQVRERAAKFGLEQATIADSQEVCFLGGGDYREFLSRAGALGSAGTITMHDTGDVVGTHDGTARFTLGQRRGLSTHVDQRALARAGVTDPVFVTGIDGATGTVVVGGKEALYRNVVELEDATSWISNPPTRVTAQLRYSTRVAPPAATVTWHGDGTATVHCDEPVHAPAPGQTACLYDDRGAVVAVGTIRASSLTA